MAARLTQTGRPNASAYENRLRRRKSSRRIGQ
jgi:hypothetical protein